MPDVYIPLTKINGAVHGDRVIVRITDWGKNKKPQGEVLQVLDEADENDRVMKEILIGKRFCYYFPGKSIGGIRRTPRNHSGMQI